MHKRRQGLVLFILMALVVPLAVHCRPGLPAATPTPTKTRALPSLPTATLFVQATEPYAKL